MHLKKESNLTNWVLLRAILAGVYIGIAGLAYLSVDTKIVGSLLFSAGLLLVVTKGYNLYTGKIGYLLPYEKGFMKMIVLTMIGNIIGIFFIGILFLLARQTDINSNAEALIQLKLAKGPVQTFVLSIFCGMLMYTGVHGYKTIEHEGIRMIIVVFSVMIFILAGFEHSIANLLYIVVGRSITLKSVIYFILWALGNMVGAVSLNVMEHKIRK